MVENENKLKIKTLLTKNADSPYQPKSPQNKNPNVTAGLRARCLHTRLSAPPQRSRRPPRADQLPLLPHPNKTVPGTRKNNRTRPSFFIGPRYLEPREIIVSWEATTISRTTFYSRARAGARKDTRRAGQRIAREMGPVSVPAILFLKEQ